MKYLLSLLQINHSASPLAKSIGWFLKFTVTGICVYFILSKVDFLVFESWKSGFQENIIIGVVILLMPLNWFLEAIRWKVAIKEEQLTLHESFRAVLAGLALNWVIPFTLGDVGGRLIGIQKKVQATYALISNRLLITLPTAVLGGLSILYYYEHLDEKVFIGSLIGMILIGGMSLNSNQYTIKIFGITIARYFVFSFQFYLLLSIYLPEVASTILLVGISWIYFFRSFIPSLFGNFGVREASALVFFDFLPNPSIVLIPCMLIWIINTVVPSLFGAGFILKLKFNIAQ